MCVDILSESLPFIQRFHRKTIRVKDGGAAMKSLVLQSSINNLVLLSPPQFHNGLRITDALTMEVVEMVLIGKANKSLVSLINIVGATTVGLYGKDTRLLTARPAPDAVWPWASWARGARLQRERGHDNGGDCGRHGGGEADPANERGGDQNDSRSLVKEIDIDGVRMVEKGKVAGGMIPKVNYYVRSLAQEFRMASIIDGRIRHSLLPEILIDEGIGTMIRG
ncbi:Acetylglutamate kinase, chloroplastic [Cocos nucifera]|uniref:Acetylglutamate kinase, chloroplastic n=1 Tax=Cocos nucifera TaxID=13894 RepID=A0A8K0IG83_COCNU|nr:Acetylglutamate kinase, chloroplastic [Cocos nucifera]